MNLLKCASELNGMIGEAITAKEALNPFFGDMGDWWHQSKSQARFSLGFGFVKPSSLPLIKNYTKSCTSNLLLSEKKFFSFHIKFIILQYHIICHPSHGVLDIIIGHTENRRKCSCQRFSTFCS